MFRFFSFACFAAAFCFLSAFSQNLPETNKSVEVTPEMTAILAELQQSLSQAEPNQRVMGLFRLLGFQIQFEDKTASKKTIQTLLALAPTIEPEQRQHQLYEGIANAYCDIQEYPEAANILNQIKTPADRSEALLNISVKIVNELERDKNQKQFDAAGLLRQAIAGAVEAKNSGIEALAQTFLGRELARQGKPDEAVIAFADARKTAKKIEEVEEQNVVGLIIRCQGQYGMITDALANLETVSDPEAKQTLTALFIQSLINNKKFDEAEGLLKTFPAGERSSEVKDSLILAFFIEIIETITDDKIGELIQSLSSDAQRERFLQQLVVRLRKNGRTDVAQQVSKRLGDPQKAQAALWFGELETLVENKKFAEALKVCDSMDDNQLKQAVKRQIFATQYRENHDESVVQQIAALYSDEEKSELAELSENAQKSTEIADAGERFDTLFEVMQSQFRLLDFSGIRQTMKLLFVQIGKETDPARIVPNRLLLARLQTELQDKAGAKENLDRLMQYLASVKEVNELKGLVPSEQESAPAEAGKIKINLPQAVDTAAIQNQLFQVYLTAAALLSKNGALAEAKSAFAKAKELAAAEPEPIAKAEKLLTLAQVLAEL